MNVVHFGDNYQIYSNSLTTYNELPVGTYTLTFNKMQGFYLVSHPDFTISEKLYGCTEEKVNKILNSFSEVNRNFGVILSGKKGIGKSLFSKLLAIKANACGIPTILVSFYVPGLADFISSIDQRVMVLFDEFEKTFAGTDECHPQDDMLSLFDGMDGGNKLFVITCNELNKLNTYLLNRPGRFHYHFILSNPSAGEITEYLTDNLKEEYYNVIPKIVSFAMTSDVTYDILRAIVLEINHGYSLKETLTDLNICKDKETSRFDITIHCSDGTDRKAYNVYLDFYSNDPVKLWFGYNSIMGLNNDTSKFSVGYEVIFLPSDVKVNEEKNFIYIPLDKINVTEMDSDDDPVDGAYITSCVLERYGYAHNYKYLI